jgi:hypothetical protein
MKRTLLLMSTALLLCLNATAQSKDDSDKNADRAQVVGNAEIVKIDAKKKTLQVTELVQPATPSRSGQNGTGGRRSGGGGGGRRGGGGGGGGGGYPGGRTGTRGGQYPGAGSGTAQAKQYKVFVSNQTDLKFAGVDIDFAQLHVGDHIIVSGYPKGTKGDLDATTVTRD